MTPPTEPPRLTRWLPTLGLLAWAGSLLLFFALYRKTLTGGEVVLAAGLWGVVLAVVARTAVRDMFGPVFFYDAVRTGRSRITFVLRFLYAGTFALLLGGSYLTLLNQQHFFDDRPGVNQQFVSTSKLSQFAYGFFQLFAVVQYLIVAVLTPVYVAGAIAVEKERKTLEFLLATDLRNREIVFGKVASRVLNLLAFVFAGLPVVAILQLLGGIDPNELLGMFAVTVVTVLGLSALSIWLSTMMRKSRDAIMLAYILVATYVLASFFVAILPLIPPPTGYTFFWQNPIKIGEYTLGTVADVFFAFGHGNPALGVMRVEMGKARGGGGPPIGGTADEVVYDFAVFWLLAAAVFLSWSILRVRAVTLGQAYGPVRQPRGAKARAARRYPEVGDNPVFWKEVFVEGGGRGGLWRAVNVVVLLLVFAWLPFIIWFGLFDPYTRSGTSFPERYDRFAESLNVWTKICAGALSTLLFFAAAIRGAGAVSGEKDRDTWLSLISTPLSADTILWGKWWGCVLGLRKGFLIVCLIHAVALVFGAVQPILVGVSLAASAVCASAFAWLGLYCGMRAKNGLNASIQAFFAALFFAGGFWVFVGCLCAFPLSLMNVRGKFPDHAAQIVLGATPPFMVGGPLHRSFNEEAEYRWENRPFDFAADEGFGFYSIPLGIVVWVLLNGLLMAVSVDKFRSLTNRKPVPLPKAPRPPKAAAGPESEKIDGPV